MDLSSAMAVQSWIVVMRSSTESRVMRNWPSRTRLELLSRVVCSRVKPIVFSDLELL
ncbi:hypothetical protein C1H46_009306 [Malus baccata]|uniref:Uncharacterized protein n=1 Tax=Malus baccata TaxID=106549 RepID=A0A540N2B2_MALBA|nr:hypothetical protein C1H46_009306 [Malus baccata]